MPTMRAAVLTGYGGVERLELRQVRRPVPSSGQLLVRVRAAGVNPIDWKIRQGRLRLLLPARFPLVLGFDVAGEVAAIGPEVAEFAPGDPVYAMLDSRHGGGYAEYAVTSQAAAAFKPETLSWEEAAAMRPAASATSPSSWPPPPSAPMSPRWPAPATRTSSAVSAPSAPSTTPGRTSS